MQETYRHPTGWELDCNNVVLRFLNMSAFSVNCRADPHGRNLTLHFSVRPPSLTRLKNEMLPTIRSSTVFQLKDPIDFDSDSVKSQVASWKPEEWEVVLPTEPPLLPQSYAALGFDFSISNQIFSSFSIF